MKKLSQLAITVMLVLGGYATSYAAEQKYSCRALSYAYIQNFNSELSADDYFYNDILGTFVLEENASFSETTATILLQRQVVDVKHNIQFNYDIYGYAYQGAPYFILQATIYDYTDTKHVFSAFSREYLYLSNPLASVEAHMNSANYQDYTEEFIRAAFLTCAKN